MVLSVIGAAIPRRVVAEIAANLITSWGGADTAEFMAYTKSREPARDAHDSILWRRVGDQIRDWMANGEVF